MFYADEPADDGIERYSTKPSARRKRFTLLEEKASG
jgi:hypothetical protein